MKMLVDLGERDLILRYAMREKVPAVLDIAAQALYPEPTEFLIHLVTVVRGPDANFAMRFHVPNGNYLYAADALAQAYFGRKSFLHYYVIEAAGLAELSTFAPYLSKHLNASLETFSSARARGDSKAIAGVSLSVNSDGSDTWSRPSLCAIESAVALRRMGQDVVRGHVDRMLYELPEAMGDCYAPHETEARLRWVLFDISDERQYAA